MIHRSCNICDGENFEILEADGDFKVVECQDCGLVFVNPQPDQTKLFEHYNEEYYAAWLNEQAVARKKMWRKRVKKIQRFEERGRLLDVGCGTALFADVARHEGWDVCCTEVSEYAARHAREDLGIETFRGELKDADFPDEFFNVITLWHVLEHTRDPLENLMAARRMLKPDGLLVIAVPNVRNYIYRAVYAMIKWRQPKLFSVNAREIHLYHFSVHTLKKIMDKAGFVALKVDIDRERIIFGERIIDILAWLVYKIAGINLGLALEIYAKKT